jgi:pimeloyl-ACP methyl ester carboxylesterase
MKFLDRNGVQLAYVEGERDMSSVVLIHGWGCNQIFMAPLFECLSRSYHVVSVDLRGHGKSGSPHQDYTMAGFADDLAWQCQQLQLERPVFIGHGMGGAIALELAARYPLLPAALVLIDSILFPTLSFTKSILPLASVLRGKGYLDALDVAISSLFLATDDVTKQDQTTKAIKKTPQHVLSSTFKNYLLCYDAAQAARNLRLPIAYIGGTAGMVDLTQFGALCPQLVTGQAIASGRFSPLDAPDQLNAMIARFLDVYVGGDENTRSKSLGSIDFMRNITIH